MPGFSVIPFPDFPTLGMYGYSCTSCPTECPPSSVTTEKGEASIVVCMACPISPIVFPARAGNTIGDIGHAIQTTIEASPFSVVTELGGHSVGHEVHEYPYIPNVGKSGKGMTLKPGMVLALEPIVNEGSADL